MSVPAISVWGVTGIPEIAAGDDLVGSIGSAIVGMGPEHALADGDILVVTSKIVSKAEGRQVPAADREKAIADDTVRVVAERVHPGGVTRIVETRQGMIMAAAGLDMSNVPEGFALKLPEDPDRSARALCLGLRRRFGIDLGVVVTDTVGRPWRVGQTDLAIGAAGLQLTDDLRGANDANGRPLHVTMAVVADEIAGAADLVKGKTSGIPVAVVRGVGRLVTGIDAPGARTLVRTGDDDMFRFGSAEAYRLGYEAAMAEMKARAQSRKRAKAQKQD
ncbi:coenzyme F420-0:L-glutamate ligase / coenzyme F420-1:gamma-L-glutamate ligase [Devosia crocina]|uniref:Coenzyme F420-0:L-glutamate ligase / coenzyme F420-1:gamma-L-glutamate ligase n=1 Tax=Devosia crocina TaxID=429728 RepID=A0A1I7NN70_9HYPH|nr:coenzyme F420-0:L-glutamate ligase [Devosia crocina]SFV36118.1 coenzyme F420-0:L-glutamate ligase / coenzyme F420-1:gamma-L-glutamate ligase [Devosia crocina]